MTKIHDPKPTQSPKSADSYQEKYHRALADYQNLEKRTKKQQTVFVQLATSAIIAKLLGLLDDLELANRHLKDPGLSLVIDKFNDLLKGENVQAINPQNAPFDPASMECVDKVAGPDNTIVTVHQKGYRLGGSLLRPAKVTVGTGKQQQKQNPK